MRATLQKWDAPESLFICETINPSTEPPSSLMLLNSKEIICAPGSQTPEEQGGSLTPDSRVSDFSV